MKKAKIGIVGAGQVGATAAHIIYQRDLGDVYISDVVEGLPQGKGLDMMESRSIGRHDSQVYGTNKVEELAICDIAVITAGLPRKPGMSREDLLNTNAKIVRDVCGGLRKGGMKGIIIVVTNPLDVMTYLAMKVMDFDKRRVIGMAGVLDSARFSFFVAEKLGVSAKDISAMVLGGHGDSMVPMPRYTTVSGIPITDLMPKQDIDKLIQRTRDGGAEIVALLKMGSAFYAPGDSIACMVEAIVKDENRVLSCACYLDGEYGLKDVVVGVPAKLGAGGVKEVIQLKLTDDEKAALRKSADGVKENIKLLKL